jgi:hypothetical protein
MQVQMTPQGRFILIAENDKDNVLLFEVTNTARTKGIQLKFGVAQDGTPDVPKEKRTYTKRDKSETVLVKCPVDGCEKQIKQKTGLSLHLYRSHGIMKDGRLVTKAHNPQKPEQPVPVPNPVVELPDGTYRLVPNAKRSLLDD